jgi:ATP-dependent DNA helicase 2 subunit 2
VELCNDGVCGTMAQAVEELSIPRTKPIRPVKSYDGPLTLGDPEHFPDSSIVMQVERWPKTKVARPPGATTVVLKSGPGAQSEYDDDEMDGVDETGGDFTNVHQIRTYKVEDASAPGGKRDVDFEDLAKGYEYGRTAVHISESEFNITKLETANGFSILGFVPADKVSSTDGSWKPLAERVNSMSPSSTSVTQTSSCPGNLTKSQKSPSRAWCMLCGSWSRTQWLDL